MCWSFSRWITRDDHSDIDTESGAWRTRRSRHSAALCFTASSVSLTTNTHAMSKTKSNQTVNYTSRCRKVNRASKSQLNQPHINKNCYQRIIKPIRIEVRQPRVEFMRSVRHRGKDLFDEKLFSSKQGKILNGAINGDGENIDEIIHNMPHNTSWQSLVLQCDIRMASSTSLIKTST